MSDALERAEHSERLRIVKRVATEAEMEVLVMRIEGYTYPEISARLRNHPQPDALRRRWFRLRQKIAKELLKGGTK